MRSTKNVVRQRIKEVLHLRLDGADAAEICHYAAETNPDTGRPWGVSRRQIERYITAADKTIGRYLEKRRDQLVGFHVSQRRMIFGRAVAKGDLRLALQTLDSEAALLGLQPPQRTRVDMSMQQPLEVVEVLVTSRQEAKDVIAAAAVLANRGGHAAVLTESNGQPLFDLADGSDAG